ncbi:MAG TPA: S8 family serine peptidase [Chloroflexia bacterium]|nr:S8 family serine peptidase [Chloroflexia bacterium]
MAKLISSAHSRSLLLLVVLALCLAGLSPIGPPVRAAAPPPPARHRPAPKPQLAARRPTAADWTPGRLVVQLAPGHRLQGPARGAGPIAGADPGLREALAAWHLDQAAVLDSASGIYRLYSSAPAFDAAAAAAALAGTPGVAYAEPDYRLHSAWVPNDPFYSKQWYLAQINAPAAWDVTTGRDSVVVAMIDTGIAANHPDLAGKLVPGYNFVSDTPNTADDNGHGTYTAGLVGAIGNNGLGVAGVAWGVRLMPVKILDRDGGGNIGDFSQGIHYAVDHGAKILNISAGIDYPTGSMEEAVYYAHSHGVVVVASAGNTPDGRPRYPAGYDGVIAVSATDEQDRSAAFSSYGSFVDLAAPGTDMISTGWSPDRLGYDWASGTSSSAPLVAGAAALLLSVRPDLSPVGVQQLLEEGSDDLGPPGWDPHYGAGRLNVGRSLQLALGVHPTPTPRPPTPAPPTVAPRTPTAAPPPPTALPPTAILPTAVPPTVPPASAILAVSPVHAQPGASVVLTGYGYAPGEAIGLRMTGPEGRNHELGTAMTKGDGTFSLAVAVPGELGPGTATLLALGAQSNRLATTPLGIDSVTQPGPPAETPGPVTGARIEGTISGIPLDAVQIYLQIGNGVRDWHYGATDLSGFYHFDNLPAGTYTVGLNARNGIPVPPPVSLELDGVPGTIRVINFQIGVDRSPPVEAPLADPGTAFAPVSDPARSGVVYFAPVQHTLRGAFLDYWQQHGGLPVFGYPISEEFMETSATDGKMYRVQYFQRNRFEYHPEYAGTPSAVLLGLLGRDVTVNRSFAPAPTPGGDAAHVYFPQTGHLLGGAFLAYWQSHGGLAIFGYPISEEIAENGYTVQYFERNRFEYHPEYAGTPSAVLLGLLGVDVARAKSLLP